MEFGCQDQPDSESKQEEFGSMVPYRWKWNWTKSKKNYLWSYRHKQIDKLTFQYIQSINFQVSISKDMDVHYLNKDQTEGVIVEQHIDLD